MMTMMQKRLIIIFLTMVFATLFVTLVRAEECFWQTDVCFGINWKTATPADVADVNINARDKDGWTPLHVAARFNATPAIIKALLTAGAEINARDKSGNTPLHRAAQSNETPAVIQALLTAGAEINARNEYGETPLHWAAESSETLAVIQALATAGAEINARNDFDWTPLHWAAHGGETPAVIITLLNHGANPKLKNHRGETAFDLAQYNDKIKNTEAYWALNDALYNNP